MDRYTYGNSGWPAPFTPEAELVIETPRREREMINLARQQVEAQNHAPREIVKSNIANAQIIAAELNQQTHALELAISNSADKISDSVSFAADQISDAIDILGNRICMELSEIRWQLIQQNETLEQILDALRESRNNEAQQLVRQGVRHYVNAEYDEAEERFKRALESDTTDYQVLMNLGYIEMHKDDAANAFTYFKKALSLPDNLDPPSKSKTMWALARLHYTQEDYSQAFSYAKEAFMAYSQDYARDSYNLGVYAALAGQKEVAMKQIKEAILAEPTYFATAAAGNPDLEPIREDVLHLLSDLSEQVVSKTEKLIKRMEFGCSSIERKEKIDQKDDLLDIFRSNISKARKLIEAPSYSGCLHCYENLELLSQEYESMKYMYLHLYSQKYIAETNLVNTKNENQSQAIQKEPERTRFERLFYDNPLGTGYFIIGLSVAVGVIVQESYTVGASIAMVLILTIVWPMFLMITTITHQPGEAGAFAGMAFGFLLFGLIWFIVEQRKTERVKRAQTISEAQHKLYEAESAVKDIKEKITAERQLIIKHLTSIQL